MPDCTPSTLTEASKCLNCLTHKQLLAVSVYINCTANGMDCTPETLLEGAKCLLCMTEKQLIASLVYVLCQSGGGSSGGGVSCGASDPVDTPTTTCAVYINTTTGRIWWYYTGQWN
jgi:hypothetical protein